MGSNLVFKYPLDTTGVSPTNLVPGEIHTLNTNPNRAFVSNYGPFYTESMIVVDVATGLPLRKGVDYKAIQYFEDASIASGLEVCGIVVITNPLVSNTVAFTAQVVGGQYSNYAYALQQMINDLQLNDQVIQWGQIIGKPALYPPAPHIHSVDDTYGWEYIVSAIDDLRQAILTGSQGTIDAMRQSLQSQFNLYQLKLGYVPVKQGASLGNDSGLISFYSDGNGNIIGTLNNQALGQVLFSSSQINQTLADLQNAVANLANAVTWGSTNQTPADGAVGVQILPTLVGDMYWPQYGIPQAARIFQLITSKGDFSAPMIQTSISPASTGASDYVLDWTMTQDLSASGSYAWRYRDITIKNQYSVWSDPTYFTTSADYVLTPNITAPVNNSTGAGPAPTVTYSAFQTSGAADSVSSVSLRVLNSAGVVVWELDNTTDAGALAGSYTVPAGYLKPGATYTVQVRYFGNALGASAWSAPVKFTTASAFITTPSIISPTNGQLLSTLTPVVQISAFQAAIGSDTLHATSIRVLNSAGIVVWEQDNNTVQLNNIQIPQGVLVGGGYTYTIQVQYIGTNYGASAWSPAVSVKTATFVTTQRATSQSTLTTWTTSFTTTSSWLTSAQVSVNTTIQRATTTSWTTSATTTTTWTSTNAAATRTTSQTTTRVSSWVTTYLTGVAVSRTTSRVSSYTTTFQTGVAKSRTTSRVSSYTTSWQTSQATSRTTTTSYYTIVPVCVAEGTPVRLPNGLDCPVELLRVGQEIASYDLPGLIPETTRADDYMYYQTDSIDEAGPTTTKIAAITKNVVPQLYVIYVKGGDDPLRVTPEHPLFVRDAEGTYRFLSADQLTADDRLIDPDGQEVDILRIQVENGSFTIYKVDCSPYDLFIHQNVIGHNMKVGGNYNSQVITSNATLTSYTTYWTTSQVTSASVSYTTSWTSYYNTSNVTSATVSYTTSYTSYINTSRTTSTVVSYVTSWTTTYSSTATLSRSTTTSFTTSQQTNTTVVTTVVKTTSYLTSVSRTTSSTVSRNTTTTWLTDVLTAT